MLITHLTTLTAWQTAQTLGEYRAPSLETEGFIHCSTPAQILGVANAFYRDMPALVLLWIDPAKTRAEVRWEAPAHPGILSEDSNPVQSGDGLHTLRADSVNEKVLFPHLYGVLNLDAVVGVVDFLPNAEGFFMEISPLPVAISSER